MAKEQRLIDADAFHYRVIQHKMTELFPNWKEFPEEVKDMICEHGKYLEMLLETEATVDAVPMDNMKEFAKDVVYQFGYYGQYNGRLHIGHGGLSTLEEAFDILGWDNPHPAPEFECEIDGCHEHATCGAPTSDGYKRMCGKHFDERRKDGNRKAAD